MELEKLLVDDDAVSPVIGVILMVAITVILAAVIGTFVLGIGSNQQATPSASFNFDYNSSATGADQLTISHTGGDTFSPENTGEGGSECTSNTGLSVTGAGLGTCWQFSNNGGDISAGDTVDTLSNAPNAGETVRIIWGAPNDEKTQTVADFDVPS